MHIYLNFCCLLYVRGNMVEQGSISYTVLHPYPNFCALRPTFKKLFNGARVPCKAQMMGVGHKAVYEINPWVHNYTDIEKKIQFLD